MNTPSISVTMRSLNGKKFIVTVTHCSLLDTQVDAIVNAANCEMRGGSGINGVIQQKAGPELLKTLEELAPKGCPTGEVVVTEGFKTGFKYIFHTPGPIWKGGYSGEDELLENSYWNCLNEANRRRLKSIGFCSISTGIYGYPLQEGAEVAMDSLTEYITTAIDDFNTFNLDEVVFAMFQETEYKAFKQSLQDIFVPWAEDRIISDYKRLSIFGKAKLFFEDLLKSPKKLSPIVEESSSWNDSDERDMLTIKENQGVK